MQTHNKVTFLEQELSFAELVAHARLLLLAHRKVAVTPGRAATQSRLLIISEGSVASRTIRMASCMAVVCAWTLHTTLKVLAVLVLCHFILSVERIRVR